MKNDIGALNKIFHSLIIYTEKMIIFLFMKILLTFYLRVLFSIKKIMYL